MRESDQIDRIEVIRELMSLADGAEDGWILPRKRRWVPVLAPSVRGKIASIAAVAVTVSLGAALWSQAPAASTPAVKAVPVQTSASAGSTAGHWLVSTGRPVNVFACSQEYLRSVSAANGAGVPSRAAFVTDCVGAASRQPV